MQHTNKTYRNIVLTAMAAVLTVALAMAFNSNGKGKATSPRKLITTWYYTGSQLNGVADTSNWTTVDPNDPRCGESTDLPCYMTIDATDKNDLNSFLSGKSNAEIKSYAVEYRPEE